MTKKPGRPRGTTRALPSVTVRISKQAHRVLSREAKNQHLKLATVVDRVVGDGKDHVIHISDMAHLRLRTLSKIWGCDMGEAAQRLIMREIKGQT